MSCISKVINDPRCDFAGNYELSNLPAVKTLERDVLGCDYGGTSWTTREQVDHIAESLELRPGVRLLEVGSGSGWPGLYLGSRTGCEVTLLDIPIIALRQAVERASEDDITGRITAIAGSGAALPFASGSFDRLSHSDVLCCLSEKAEMLRECRRVAGDNARMHFSVILPAPDISSSKHQQALELGPPFVDAPAGYESMLRESAWQILERIDVSAEYGQSLRKLVDGMNGNAAELQQALGSEELESQRNRRAKQVELIERGILLREVYVTLASD